MRVRAGVVVAGLVSLVLVLAACGGEPAGPGPTLSAPVPTVTEPSPSPSGPLAPTRPTPGRSAPAETLTGTVVSGVEQGCVVLETDQGNYLLIGEAADEAPIGETATVRGQVRTDMATTCQQGIPFEVTEVLD